MDSAEKALRELIDRHLPSPSHMEAVASHGRVLDRLRSEPAHLQKPRIADVEPSVSRWSPAISAAAAAAVLAVAVGMAMFWPGGDAALYRVVDGIVQSGDTIRTNGGAGAMLALADDSRVEMRAQSELLLERAEDGVRIRLNRGGIIVSAATQRSGHLYVQTREMTVAVVGTVFLVNAAEDGSRVAVIEGEVRVREGALEKRLRPGEQVSTSPVLAARPLREEIAWSRHADAHLAILESFMKGMAQTTVPLTPLARQADVAGAQTPGAQGVALEFEEASVRECDPDNLPPSLIGARGGGANSVMMTPGRYYALCVTPATLIRTSHGYRAVGVEALLPDGLPRRGGRAPIRGQFGVVGSLGAEDGLRVRGGPDWVRNERFTIEAVASGTPDAATMSGPMLRALFERRFKLKTHVETEQTLAYNLVVAPGGLKIKPVPAGSCEVPPQAGSPPSRFRGNETNTILVNGMPLPIPRPLTELRRAAKPSCAELEGPNGPNWVMLAGEATFGELTQFLRARLGNGIGVTDKTGISDKFNWDLEVAVDANARPGSTSGIIPDADANVPRAPTIFVALEEQLGLRLEPARAPREFIVIDQVERPSAN